MDRDGDLQVVLCAPGFPASTDDHDKPFLYDHATALVSAGLNVRVVCPASPGLPAHHTVGDVEVFRVRYAPRRIETLAATGAMYREARGLKALLVAPMIISLTCAMIRQMRSKKAVAYGHWWIPGGVVAVVAARCTRQPSVVHLHGSDAAIAQNRVLRVIARLVLRYADVRLGVSESLASWGESVSQREVKVLTMPLDEERLPAPSPVPEDGFVLGVGRLVPEKGFDVLIEAVGLIGYELRPPVTIVGVGPERDLLLDRARRLGVDLHLPGAVSPREMGDWYRRARIVAVPSRREGFGLVGAEASAAARAVVATKVGGLPDFIEHGVSGLLVEPNDPAAFAKALTAIDPEWGSRGPSRVASLGTAPHGAYVRRICEDLLN